MDLVSQDLIGSSRSDKGRRGLTVEQAAYRDLIHYAGLVKGYALAAIPELALHEGNTVTDTFAGRELARRLERALGRITKSIDQTDRRVFKGEKVPASEKIVPFLEDHTDSIVKGKRETEYGHKVFLSGGASGIWGTGHWPGHD